MWHDCYDPTEDIPESGEEVEVEDYMGAIHICTLQIFEEGERGMGYFDRKGTPIEGYRWRKLIDL